MRDTKKQTVETEYKPDLLSFNNAFGLLINTAIELGHFAYRNIVGENGVMEVINGLHLENKEGVRPYLVKKYKTETGKDYVFSLPPGVDREDFEKNQHYFEAYTNSTVEIESKGRKLILKTHTKEFAKEIKFKFDPSDYEEE